MWLFKSILKKKERANKEKDQEVVAALSGILLMRPFHNVAVSYGER